MNYDRGGVFAERPEVLPPARFLLLPVKNKRATIEAGHDIYVDKPYIEILKQGGATCQFAVTDEFKNRYPEKWKAFQTGLEEPKTGLPLEKWPGCTRAECENLKSVNLFTVEDLANASDIGLDSYGMGAREIQKRAKSFLEAAKDSGAMASKLEDLENKLNLLISRNEELESISRTLQLQLEASKSKPEPEPETLTLSTPAKRGRPRKE